ncbi:MAG: redoxin domain-containing protein [Bryobacterales bacterium]|nr:redoxin domain-containing protein [Bryobacterales bacterium]MDE0294676.1 redoxin domain-containing protein [Bryobacterales bacterium]
MPISGLCKACKEPTLALHIVLPVLAILLMSLSCGGSDPEVVLLDLDGRSVAPLEEMDAPASVFIFSSVDCPVSNRYAPEVKRLKAEFADQGARFWLVYPNPAETPDAIRQHLKDFGYDFDALRDPEHRLVDLTRASVTPEAAVFTSDNLLAYRGRIDDRQVDFGKVRPRPTKHDLEEALQLVLAGESFTPRFTTAVGCYISDMKR